MIDRIRRFWSAVLRAAGLRAPHGHMEMLRDTVDRREGQRVARETENAQRRAGSAMPPPDEHTTQDRIE